MAKVLAKAHVEDFDRFLEVFSSRGAEHRKGHGSHGSLVMRGQEDPNEVWVLFDWEPDEYKDFIQDEKSREIMQAAGLQGPPEPVFVEEVGHHDS